MAYRDEHEALRAEERRLEQELSDARDRIERLEREDPHDQSAAFAARRRKLRVRTITVGLVFAILLASGVLLRVRPMRPGFVVFLFAVLVGSIGYLRFVFLRCPGCEQRLQDARVTRCPQCGAHLTSARQ